MSHIAVARHTLLWIYRPCEIMLKISPSNSFIPTIFTYYSFDMYLLFSIKLVKFTHRIIIQVEMVSSVYNCTVTSQKVECSLLK